MKKIVSLLLVVALLVTTCPFVAIASESDNIDVYVNEKLSTRLSAKFYDGEPYLCIEEIFSFFGYDSRYSRYSYSGYVIHMSMNDEDLFDFTYSDYNYSEPKSSTKYEEEGQVHFGTAKTEVKHKFPIKEVDEKHHYIHFTDLKSLLTFKLVPCPEVNVIALYTMGRTPEYITLYNRKGNEAEICDFLKDKYLAAGYKENKEDVILLPESTPVPADGIKVSLNGALLKFDVTPTTINGRTMVPLRAIFEALSASVQWHEETQTIVSTKDDTTIKLTIDSDKMIKNDKTITLDCPATEVNGRTLVPVRAISEAFGLSVEWNDIESLVILREPKYIGISTAILYNLEGQAIEVADYEKESYIKDGWLTDKPVKMYSVDGSSKVVEAKDVQKNKDSGWYTYPVTTMYAPDGRTQVVAKSDVEANKAVGWYTYPVTTMYALDGRTITIATSEVQSYINVGWYTYSQYALRQYSYLAGSDFRSIRRDYSHAKAFGAFMYSYTNCEGDFCILVTVGYSIGSSHWYDHFLHNISKGTRIESPDDYYDNIADTAWGPSRLHYLDLGLEVLKAQEKTLSGFIDILESGSTSVDGLFVDGSILNL